jgi:hypothetical protein
MSFSNAQAFAGLRATATPDAPQTRNNNEVGFAPFTANLTDAESVYSVRATLADGDVLSLDTLAGDAGESVLAGAPETLTVTGTLTDGTDPVVFPVLLYVEAGLWTSTGAAPGSGEVYFISNNAGDSNYELVKLADGESVATWVAVQAVATPDLVTTWTPIATATGTPTITGSGVTSEITGGDGNDIYGDPLPTIDTIQGMMIKCISGAADIEVNGNELKSLTAGDVRLAFNPAGMPSYADDLEATATAANTVLEIVVIGKNA